MAVACMGPPKSWIFDIRTKNRGKHITCRHEVAWEPGLRGSEIEQDTGGTGTVR
jgi:hypothetical protein